MSQKSQEAKNIGARFRSARSLVPNLNRKSFCERHGINRYTMQSWENGLHVSKGRNVEKFIEALAREGVTCTSEWLIEGVGDPAKPLNGVGQSTPFDTGGKIAEEKGRYSQEIDRVINVLENFYEELEAPVVSYRVPDDTMAPKFLVGDLVIGRALKNDECKAAHQKFCIVELGPAKYILRKVIYHKDGFILMALDERLPSFTLKLDSNLYLVMWHLMQQ